MALAEDYFSGNGVKAGKSDKVPRQESVVARDQFTPGPLTAPTAGRYGPGNLEGGRTYSSVQRETKGRKTDTPAALEAHEEELAARQGGVTGAFFRGVGDTGAYLGEQALRATTFGEAGLADLARLPYTAQVSALAPQLRNNPQEFQRQFPWAISPETSEGWAQGAQRRVGRFEETLPEVPAALGALNDIALAEGARLGFGYHAPSGVSGRMPEPPRSPGGAPAPGRMLEPPVQATFMSPDRVPPMGRVNLEGFLPEKRLEPQNVGAYFRSEADRLEREARPAEGPQVSLERAAQLNARMAQQDASMEPGRGGGAEDPKALRERLRKEADLKANKRSPVLKSFQGREDIPATEITWRNETGSKLRTGQAWADELTVLRKAGLIEKAGNRLRLTDEGRRLTGGQPELTASPERAAPLRAKMAEQDASMAKGRGGGPADTELEKETARHLARLRQEAEAAGAPVDEARLSQAARTLAENNLRQKQAGAETRAAQAANRQAASQAKAKSQRLAEVQTHVDALSNASTPQELLSAIKPVRVAKVLPGEVRAYYKELQDYTSRRTFLKDAYLQLTGGKLGAEVPIKDLQAVYDRMTRGRSPADVAKGGTEFYAKDERALKRHLYGYGRRIGESFEEAPSKAAPWLIDEQSGTVRFSPYFPDAAGAAKLAESLPLDQGVRMAEKLPAQPRMVPEIQPGRVPFSARTAEGGGGAKEPPKGPPPPPPGAGAPLEGDIRPPQRKKTTSAGRRIEGEVKPEAEDFGRVTRVGASGFELGPTKGKGRRPFVNPESRKDVWAAIERVVSPSALSEGSRGAEQIIRAIEGVGRRQTAMTAADLDKYVRAVDELLPAAKEDLVHYIQTGGTEGALADLEGVNRRATKPFRELATSLANLYKGYENEIRALPNVEKEEFISNYLPQMYKNKGAFRKHATTFLKERRIPTYKDAKALGLEPETTNPIDMTLAYAGAMRKFLDIRHMVREGMEAGYVQKLDRRRALPPNTRFINFGGKGGSAYFANEDFARVFNNYVSRGFQSSPEVGGAYNGLLRMSNASTALQLGLSAYHLSTMLKESFLASLADGIKHAAKGNMGKAVGKFANAWRSPYDFYKRGDELVKAYLQDPDYGLDTRMARLGDLASKANMRIGDMDEVYRASALGSYGKTLVRALESGKGGLKWGLQAEARETGRSFKEKPLTTPFSVAGRLIETVAHPLFYHYIPRLKAGVFMERMSTFLEEHPTASMEEQVRHAQRIADVIDDQFGELVQNNVFWDAHLKQTANLLLTSTGWTLGTLRVFGQGTADLARMKLTDRAAYVLASVAGISAINAVYQALKTGTAPQGAQDLLTPQTGGKTVQGDPERALLPGYEKDLMGWWHGGVSELYNKLGVFPKTATELATNRDWRGDPIHKEGSGSALSHVLETAGHVLLNYVPLSLKSASTPTSPETNLSGAERFMGVRPAGQWLTNPERTDSLARYFGQKAWNKKLAHEAKDAARSSTVAKTRRAEDYFAKPAPKKLQRAEDYFAH